MDAKLQGYIDKLNKLNFKEMYENDFFLTWEKTDDEIDAVFTVADALRYMRENNISTKVFESGLGISLFRDNSTRTRFSFASACNLLGLEVQDLDEKKSQIAHGETEVAVADVDLEERHQEVRTLHGDEIAVGPGQLDVIGVADIQAGEAGEMVFFGFGLGRGRIGRLAGGERQGGGKRRGEKGDEAFHDVFIL